MSWLDYTTTPQHLNWQDLGLIENSFSVKLRLSAYRFLNHTASKHEASNILCKSEVLAADYN